ncbi:MAG: response regulator transcription factor [Chloroflexi bacterium]|nr:response regulator transcription factor [Chloroflexota bacterium]
MKFLVVDDNQDIIDAVSLCINLRWPQAEVISTSEGRKAEGLVEEQAPDLVILDIGLPDINGLQVLKGIRAFSDVPVVMLTARDLDVEVARFLEEGADDYVVKPFSHVELLGRLQAIFRRVQGRASSSSRPLQAGDLLIDLEGAEVYRAGEPVSLTRTELNMLAHLVRNAQRVVSYESLASNILRVTETTDADNRLVKVHIQHLRAKLGDPTDNPRYIANVYGIGYKFLPQVTSGVVGSQQERRQSASEQDNRR